jgi:glycosyltransferase involved in cell wall biosynthesis
MAKICLVTPGQPSINPRLVKEADALVAAGHDVNVLCSHTVSWADETDKKLLSTRKWNCSYVGGEKGSMLYLWTRMRYAALRRFPAAWRAGSWLGDRVVSRVSPELLAAAVECKADLYIAHYTGALSAAVVAARHNSSRVAFDAEDFESGYYDYDGGPKKIDLLVEDVERKFLPECCYLTAASPGIAAAYQRKYGTLGLVTILNVFSLSERPREFRTTSMTGPLRLYWFSQTIGLGRGLEDVIRAIGKLSDCDIEVHLRGLLRPDHWKQLQGLLAANRVRSRSIVLHNPASPDEMICSAAEFDVGLALEQPCTPNHDLCLSNKIFAYLLAGNAIAATATTGQQAIVKRLGKAAFLYAPGDVDALADGLRRWSRDREQLQQARREAWSWGTHPFNWEVEKEKFLQVVEGALKKGMYCH